MPEDMIRSLSPGLLGDLLRDAGFRAETVKTPAGEILRSATNGFAFEVRFADPLPDGSGGGFADCTFMTGLTVQGELPLAPLNKWNAARRFARLFFDPPTLILAMDVSVWGGISKDALRAQMALWDRLIPDLIQFLRDELPKPEETSSHPPANGNASA